MIEGPTGLRPSGPYPPAVNDEAWPLALVSSAATAAVGVALTAVGVRTANEKMILGGVALAVEGTVSMAALAAGGTSKQVTEIREGFKYWPTKIHETAVLKGVEALARKLLSAEDARQLAVAMDAANKTSKVAKGGEDNGLEAVAGLMKIASSEAIRSQSAGKQAKGNEASEKQAKAAKQVDGQEVDKSRSVEDSSVNEGEGSADRTGAPEKRPGSSNYWVPDY